MKRIVSFLLTGILVLSLTSCSNGKTTNPNSTDTNVISISQLTQREKLLLSATGNDYYVFEYNVDKSYNWVSVWVEQYESGQKISDGGILSSEIAQNKKSMLIATMNHPDKNNYYWSLSCGNGISKFTETSQKEPFSKFTKCNTLKQIPISTDDIVLACICYKGDSDTSFSAISEQFFKKPAENMKEIADCQLTYLLKCKFTKDEPSK